MLIGANYCLTDYLTVNILGVNEASTGQGQEFEEDIALISLIESRNSLELIASSQSFSTCARALSYVHHSSFAFLSVCVNELCFSWLMLRSAFYAVDQP